MRFGLFAICLSAIALPVLVNGAATAPLKSSTPLRPFEFKGVSTDQRIANLDALQCIGTPERITGDCATVTTFAGEVATIHYLFQDGWLVALKITADRSSYETIRSSLMAKYGPPCNFTHSTWQNAMGAALDNVITTWCFSKGKLNLLQIGEDVSQTEAIYTDTGVATNAEKPVVDF